MLIWDYIRDFLVQYIFGGFDSNGDVFGGTIGKIVFFIQGEYDEELVSSSGNFFYNLGQNYDSGHGMISDCYISVGDWLSTTTTIIIMCLIVVLFALLVRWVFKTVVSAFLLR